MKFSTAIVAIVGTAVAFANVASGCLVLTGRYESGISGRNEYETLSAKLVDNGKEVCEVYGNYKWGGSIEMNCINGHHASIDNLHGWKALYGRGSDLFRFDINTKRFSTSGRGAGSSGLELSAANYDC